MVSTCKSQTYVCVKSWYYMYYMCITVCVSLSKRMEEQEGPLILSGPVYISSSIT